MRIQLLLAALVALLLGSGVIPSSSARAQTVHACDVSPAPPNCESMWALQINQEVPNGAYASVPNPGCMNDAQGDIQRVLQAAIVAGQPDLAIVSGPLSAAISGPVNDYLRHQGGDIGRLLSPYTRDAALCANLVGVIPVRATYLGYRFLATDNENGNRYSECVVGNDCAIGWSKFPSEPQLQGNDNVHVVSAMFMNWSDNRSRRARMIIFYSMPPGAQIGIRM